MYTKSVDFASFFKYLVYVQHVPLDSLTPLHFGLSAPGLSFYTVFHILWLSHFCPSILWNWTHLKIIFGFVLNVFNSVGKMSVIPQKKPTALRNGFQKGGEKENKWSNVSNLTSWEHISLSQHYLFLKEKKNTQAFMQLIDNATCRREVIVQLL